MSIASAIGSIIDAGVNLFNADKQEDAQFKMARNRIQYTVADANKAGVHPLYALGAPTMSYSPVNVGGMTDFANVGQNIDRAIAAGQPKETQLDGYQDAARKLTLEGMGLDNQYKAAQLAKLRAEVLQKPAIPNVTLPGGPHFKPGDSTTAQAVQDEYGDLVENVYGVGRLLYDGMTNLDRYMMSRNPPHVVRGYPSRRANPGRAFRRNAPPSVANSR